MTATRVKALRRLAGKVGAPVVAQGITALTSLVLQVVAARSLGLAEFGAFAVLLALLVSATTLYTGYVGDGLTVLDRQHVAVRPALVSSAVTLIILAAAVAVGAALVLRGGDFGLAAAYATVVVTWLLRDTVRRLLIARQDFGKLVLNDLVHLVTTFAALVSLHTVAGVSLVVLLSSMGFGAVMAFAIGLVGVPRHELTHLRTGWAGMRELASFAVWRSGQATLRPTAMLLARVFVANILSLTAVGMLEAARLVAAPLQVVINGVGHYLLTGYAAAERAGTMTSGRPAARAGWLLLGGTVLGGAVLAALTDPVGRLMTGGPVDPLLVLGWVAYLAVWAIGLPHVTECVARRLSREVFVARLIDSSAGLGLAAIALLSGAGVVAVPWLMAFAGLYTVWRARRLANSSR